LLLQTTLLN
jgi:electron transfer flavoprotein alpha subunit